VTLVRHGQASATWGDHPDPGLSDLGREQAAAVADALAPLGPLPILVSPLRRTRETAEPLEARWHTTATVDAAVGEIEAPGDALDGRENWLRSVMQGGWADAPDLAPWRSTVIDRLSAITTDTVVVTHFVAINVAVGHALGDDRVVCFMPQNCSRTVLDIDGDAFTVVELGVEATAQLT
jgi:broad specificity phosphatase PhoE